MWTKFSGNDEILPILPMAWLLISWSGWQIRNVIVLTITKPTITNHGGNIYFLHATWCSHVITWQTSENAYQNRRVRLLHFTRSDHANQSNQSYRLWTCFDEKYPIPTGHVIFDYVILINEELEITTLTEALRHQIWKTKITHKMHLFFELRD